MCCSAMTLRPSLMKTSPQRSMTLSGRLWPRLNSACLSSWVCLSPPWRYAYHKHTQTHENTHEQTATRIIHTRIKISHSVHGGIMLHAHSQRVLLHTLRACARVFVLLCVFDCMLVYNCMCVCLYVCARTSARVHVRVRVYVRVYVIV